MAMYLLLLCNVCNDVQCCASGTMTWGNVLALAVQCSAIYNIMQMFCNMVQSAIYNVMQSTILCTVSQYGAKCNLQCCASGTRTWGDVVPANVHLIKLLSLFASQEPKTKQTFHNSSAFFHLLHLERLHLKIFLASHKVG